MAMDLSELDVLDDDVIDSPQEPPAQEVVSEIDVPIEEEEDEPLQEEDEPKPEEDAIQQFLKSKGISDFNKIKFENEEGEIEEVAWKDLSEEEKLNILSTESEDNSDNDLDDNEIDFINRLRLSGMSIEEYLDTIKQQGAAEYAKQQQPVEKSYTVDDLTDEELYILDLQARVEDISDEECQEALDRAMANEALFKKEVAGLRADYKNMEDRRNEEQLAVQQQQQQEQFEQFSKGIVQGINNFTNLGNLNVDMNDDDKNQLYQFITGVDNAGINHFAKALMDPDTAVRTAWFALHGEDIINSISEYYNNQIQAVAKANYEKGKQDASHKERKVVVKTPTEKQVNKNIKSIDDLD